MPLYVPQRAEFHKNVYSSVYFLILTFLDADLQRM
jgi:hypothetical protein